MIAATMRRSTTKLLIVAIAIILIVPSVIVIFNALESPSAAKPASAYVPAGSSVSGHVLFNNTSLYYFIFRGSPGIILDIGAFGRFTDLNLSGNLNASGGNLSGHRYYLSTEFSGIPIFNTTVNLKQIGGNFSFFPALGQLNLTSIVPGGLNFNAFNFFFAVPSSNIVVAGLQSSVEYSILASLGQQGLTSSTFNLDRGANFSLEAIVSNGTTVYNVSLFAYRSNATLELSPVTNISSYGFQSVFDQVSSSFNASIIYRDSIARLSVQSGVNDSNFLTLLKYVLQIIVVT